MTYKITKKLGCIFYKNNSHTLASKIKLQASNIYKKYLIDFCMLTGWYAAAKTNVHESSTFTDELPSKHNMMNQCSLNTTQQTQIICITFAQRCPNVTDVGTMLYNVVQNVIQMFCVCWDIDNSMCMFSGLSCTPVGSISVISVVLSGYRRVPLCCTQCTTPLTLKPLITTIQ